MENLAKSIIDMWLEAFGVEIEISAELHKKNIEQASENISMIDLNLPTRIINSLRDANIKTVDVLIKRNPNELLAVKGLGKKSVQKIANALNQYDLELAPNGKIIAFPKAKIRYTENK